VRPAAAAALLALLALLVLALALLALPSLCLALLYGRPAPLGAQHLPAAA
jgi:hypothetical protein